MISNVILDVAIEMVERGLMPQTLTRAGVRNMCRKRLREERTGSVGEQVQRKRKQPVADGKGEVVDHGALLFTRARLTPR